MYIVLKSIVVTDFVELFLELPSIPILDANIGAECRANNTRTSTQRFQAMAYFDPVTVFPGRLITKWLKRHIIILLNNSGRKFKYSTCLCVCVSIFLNAITSLLYQISECI